MTCRCCDVFRFKRCSRTVSWTSIHVLGQPAWCIAVRSMVQVTQVFHTQTVPLVVPARLNTAAVRGHVRRLGGSQAPLYLLFPPALPCLTRARLTQRGNGATPDSAHSSPIQVWWETRMMTASAESLPRRERRSPGDLETSRSVPSRHVEHCCCVSRRPPRGSRGRGRSRSISSTRIS